MGASPGPRRFWKELVVGLPKGLPDEGDEGLDRTHTWGRTYWGGALFWFLADLEIHARTGRSLADGLRAVIAQGGDVRVEWPLARAFEVIDRAVGAPVVEELYAKMANDPYPVDLDARWRELGVSLADDRVIFDDKAPKAAVRRALTSRSGS